LQSREARRLAPLRRRRSRHQRWAGRPPGPRPNRLPPLRRARRRSPPPSHCPRDPPLRRPGRGSGSQARPRPGWPSSRARPRALARSSSFRPRSGREGRDAWVRSSSMRMRSWSTVLTPPLQERRSVSRLFWSGPASTSIGAATGGLPRKKSSGSKRTNFRSAAEVWP